MWRNDIVPCQQILKFSKICKMQFKTTNFQSKYAKICQTYFIVRHFVTKKQLRIIQPGKPSYVVCTFPHREILYRLYKFVIPYLRPPYIQKVYICDSPKSCCSLFGFKNGQNRSVLYSTPPTSSGFYNLVHLFVTH